MSAEQIGRYRLQSSLGTGGMAHVYRAVETLPSGVERLVALKCLKPELASVPEARAAFAREAKIALALVHPNIVRAYDSGFADGVHYIAMEYVPGRTIREVAQRIQRRNRPPCGAVLSILAQLCDALVYAHGQLGLIHRDITPTNIIIQPDGNAALIDFGIAKGDREHETYSGRIKGKADYMAPETVLALDLDQRTDLFSLGVVGFELLTGRSLFGRSYDRATALARVLYEPIPKSSALNPLVPPAVDHLIECALQRSQSSRWQSASEMAGAISEAMQQLFEPACPEAVARYVSGLYGAELMDASGPPATIGKIKTRRITVPMRRAAVTEKLGVRFRRRSQRVDPVRLQQTPTG